MAGIPVTVIGGFLGAGKTTLLNRWLRRAQGRRTAVLVNDFGAINIDAALVASRTADTIALTNGCVCCQIGSDLAAALMRVLDAMPAFDAILVEASGVSDPWRIAQVARADRALELAAVIVLLDADAVLEQARDPMLADTLAGQLRSADLVVVNKTDLVDARRLDAVRRWLAARAVGSRVLEARDADVPEEIASACLDHGSDDSAFAPRPLAPPVLHGARFETWMHHPSGLLRAAALRALLGAMPEGVLRLKGLVRCDEPTWCELQFAGRRGTLRRTDERPARDAAVVAIGLTGCLPRAELDAAFAAAAYQTA